jgi:hypothetical protein
MKKCPTSLAIKKKQIKTISLISASWEARIIGISHQHLAFIDFCTEWKSWCSFSLLRVDFQFSNTICWTSCLFPNVWFRLLYQNSDGCSCVGLFWIFILLYCFMSLLVPVPCCSWTMALCYNLKSGIVIPSAFLWGFFPSGLLWLFRVLLCFIWILQVVFHFCEKWPWDFNGDCT